MLKSIRIKNIALIDDIEVSFNDGLNILSGETGAGKSILIESVYLILGARAHKDLIRTGKDYLYVELTFENISNKTKEALDILELDSDVDEIILSRRVYPNKNNAYCNGELINLKSLNSIASTLINLHGQSEQVELLDEKNHLLYLDQYGDDKHQELINKVSDCYKEMTLAKRDLDKIQNNNTNKDREIDILTFEINELESASLREKEDDELEEKLKVINSSMDIIKLGEMSSEYIDGNDGIEEKISAILKQINNINVDSKEIEDMKSQLLTAEDILLTVASLGRDMASNFDFSDEEINNINERYDLLNKLKSKYNTDIKGLIKILDDNKQKLEMYNDIEAYTKKAIELYESKKEEFNKYALKLTNSRKDLAKKFEKSIKEELSELGFIQNEFEIQVGDAIESTLGVDDVVYFVSLNPGEEKKSLAKVASGGELSRIMLAIKVVLGASNKLNTLVFDEIDTGISGATAEMVGTKLQKLATNNQILCITHLAQIAAMGDNNYLIYKEVENDRTYTKIKELNEDEIASELSRMIGGKTISDQVKQSAIKMRQDSKRKRV